ALAARDGGCSFPGCDAPPNWAQVHHVVEWIDGGRTDLDNLCLGCGHHHRQFARRGWKVIMQDGRPWWIPPPWIDPDQTPVRNTMHPPPGG
ncbi:MAG TPA: HNH endonuclease signature motif containing protein, partial [Actinopolymorphaceae bacterium]|nr:HNH endonuclease signature motif containing protein [Actinopolymorphaceae bacterium]